MGIFSSQVSVVQGDVFMIRILRQLTGTAAVHLLGVSFVMLTWTYLKYSFSWTLLHLWF